MTLDEQIEILEAKKAGKDVEVRQRGGRWSIKNGNVFNFIDLEYRIKPEPMEFWVNVYDDGIKVLISHKANIDHYEKDGLVKTIKVREVTE